MTTNDYYGMKVDARPDPQATRVYSWNSIVGRTIEFFPLSFGALVEVTKKLSKHYGIEMPTVDVGLLPIPAYDEEDHGLYFTRDTGILMVAHEFAHILNVYTHGREVEGHGPEYVQCFIEVLSHLRRDPHDELVLSAYEHGINTTGKQHLMRSTYYARSNYFNDRERRGLEEHCFSDRAEARDRDLWYEW